MPKSVFTAKYRRMCSLLAQARTSKQITQAELAAALLKPQSFVSKYERGERRLDVVELLEIASALEIDLRGLLKAIEIEPQSARRHRS
ncbi:MAG: helix-turn-helix transcriptional regulator [Deltaproteobacteria bacterium]|nr:helix-turn-helix transcriptional regulator [Deltaproteobacteria bacterium]